jgi:hypothetical protein
VENKTMKKIIILFSISVIVVLTLQGCRDLFRGMEGETGTLIVRISDSTGKTLLPQDVLGQVDHFDLLLTKSGSSDVILSDQSETLITFSSLEEGTWNITVEGDDSSGNIIASGSASTGVTATGPNQVTVVLEPNSSGAGTVAIDFEWPAGTGVDEVEIVFGTDSPVDIYSSGDTADYIASGIPAGTYTLIAHLRKQGVLLATVVESVHVWAYLETAATIILAIEDFRSAPAVPADPIAAESLGRVDLIWDASDVKTETGFIVERSENSGSGFTGISGTLPANTGSFSDTTAVSGTIYYYRVISLNDFGQSNPTGETSADWGAPVITGLADDPVAALGKTWTWDSDDPAAEYRYIIDTSSGEPADWSSAAWGSTKTATQASGNGTFYLHVQARDGAGNQSAIATVSVVLTDDTSAIGLVVYYPFSGNANDESGNGFDGTENGGITLTSDRFGNADSAYTFDGVDDYIDLGNTIPIGGVEHSATITLWVRIDQYPSTGYAYVFLADYNSGGDSTYAFQALVSGTTQTAGFSTKYNGTGYSCNSPNELGLSEWHFLTAVIDGSSNLNFYIDGILVSTTLYEASVNYIASPHWRIGRNYYSNVMHKGDIDDVRIYDRVLTDQEISNLYNEGDWINLKQDQGLVAFYPFSGNANDEGGNENHGTVHGEVSLTTDRFGNPDSAYSFDGTDDYIQISDIDPSIITISAWINTLSHSSDLGPVVGEYNGSQVSGSRSFLLDINQGGLSGGIYNSATTYQFGNSSEIINDGLWHFIVMTWDGTEITQYIDGFPAVFDVQPSSSGSGDIFDSNQPLFIGAADQGSGREYFNGIIDDVRIYNRSLAELEINNLYTEGDWGYVEELNATLEAQGLDIHLNRIIDYNSSKTYRDMTLTSYALAETEVTQGDYQAIAGSNPSSGYGVGDNYPVYYISWIDAAQFCNDLSTLCGLDPVYNETTWDADFSQNGFYLPTEAQWEYAAGGPDNNIWSLSDTFTPGDYAFDQTGTSTVGDHPANGFGLYDMSGNVWEWCSDWYAAYYPHIGEIDPKGASSGTERIGRGGYFSTNHSEYLKTDYRSGWDPTDDTGHSNGFRVAAGGFDKWNNQVDLQLDVSEDMQTPIEITFSGYQSDLGLDEVMTVNAGFSDTPDFMQWYLNWELLVGETSESITLSSLDQGIYHLDLIVRKGDISSSETLEFRVGYLGPSVGVWTQTTTLPSALGWQSSFVRSGTLYVLGGDNGTSLIADVKYSAINSDNSLSNWTTTTSFSGARTYHQSVVSEDNVYVLGGYDGTILSDVQYASINPDKSVGTWSATQSYPTARYSQKCFAYNERIYSIGGVDQNNTDSLNEVLFSEIQPDGSLTAWQSTTVLPFDTSGAGVELIGNTVYVIGGRIAPSTNTNQVVYGFIQADGTIPEWFTTESFSTARSLHASVSYNGYLYIIGGSPSSSTVINDVQYARVDTDGTLDPWVQGEAIIGSRRNHTAEVYNGSLFVLGGFDQGTTTELSDIQYARFTE